MIALAEPAEVIPATPTQANPIETLQKTVSASRLTTFLQCRLKFFFQSQSVRPWQRRIGRLEVSTFLPLTGHSTPQIRPEMTKVNQLVRSRGPPCQDTMSTRIAEILKAYPECEKWKESFAGGIHQGGESCSGKAGSPNRIQAGVGDSPAFEATTFQVFFIESLALSQFCGRQQRAEAGQFGLRLGVSLLGGQFEPHISFSEVLRNTLTVLAAEAPAVLCVWQTLLCCLAVPFGCFFLVFWNTQP
jgi:hypothetical protein